MWVLIGLFYAEQPAHCQTVGSSSLPTSKELTRASYSILGREWTVVSANKAISTI